MEGGGVGVEEWRVRGGWGGVVGEGVGVSEWRVRGWVWSEWCGVRGWLR